MKYPNTSFSDIPFNNLLMSDNETIKRNAKGILKVMQNCKHIGKARAMLEFDPPIPIKCLECMQIIDYRND